MSPKRALTVSNDQTQPNKKKEKKKNKNNSFSKSEIENISIDFISADFFTFLNS